MAVFYFVILQPVLSVVWVADMEKNSPVRVITAFLQIDNIGTYCYMSLHRYRIFFLISEEDDPELIAFG